MSTAPRILAALAFIGAAQSVNAETIFFAGDQGVVHALDTQTGTVSFRGVCSGPVSSMVVHDGTLYLGDQNGVFYNYDVATNLVQSAFFVNTDASAMTWLGDQLVIADSSGRVDYIDPDTGDVSHSVENLSTDITAIGIDAGGLFIGGQSSLALRAHIGQDSFNFFAACGSQIQSMAFGADIMFLGGTHFFGDNNGTVYLFDKFEGGVNYSGTHDVASDVTAMVVADGMLYIGGTDGIIHEMNPQTGAIARTFDTGINIQAMTPESGIVSCPADYDANGTLNFNDVSNFINLFNNQLVPGDTTGDGEFNYFDISLFLNYFNGGC